jgi:hypothetical protein
MMDEEWLFRHKESDQALNFDDEAGGLFSIH